MKKSNDNLTDNLDLERVGTLIGKKIKDRRKKNGVSRAHLAEKSGISSSKISRLENGNGRLPILLYLQIATALEMSLPDIIREIENSP